MLIIRNEDETPFECLQRVMRRKSDVSTALRVYVNDRRRVSIDIYTEKEWREKEDAKAKREQFFNEGDLE